LLRLSSGTSLTCKSGPCRETIIATMARSYGLMLRTIKKGSMASLSMVLRLILDTELAHQSAQALTQAGQVARSLCALLGFIRHGGLLLGSAGNLRVHRVDGAD
jgi:TnpA family transposase